MYNAVKHYVLLEILPAPPKKLILKLLFFSEQVTSRCFKYLNQKIPQMSSTYCMCSRMFCILIPLINAWDVHRQRKEYTKISFSCCVFFYASSPFYCPWNRMHREEMPLLHLCSPFLRSLKSEVKDRNQISSDGSPICKIEVNLSLGTR